MHLLVAFSPSVKFADISVCQYEYENEHSGESGPECSLDQDTSPGKQSGVFFIFEFKDHKWTGDVFVFRILRKFDLEVIQLGYR